MIRRNRVRAARSSRSTLGMVVIGVSCCAGAACATALGLDDYAGTPTSTTASTTLSSSVGGAAGQGGTVGGYGGLGGGGGISGGAGGGPNAPPCPDGSQVFFDAFQRDVSSGWGGSDSGHTYELYQDAGYFSVAEGAGRIHANSTNHFGRVALAMGDLELVGTAKWSVPDVNNGTVTATFRLREAASGHFAATFTHSSAEGIKFELIEKSSEPDITLTTIPLANFSPEGFRLRLRMWGTEPMHWLVRIWPAGEPESSYLQEGDTYLDAAPPTGAISLSGTRSGPTAFDVAFDDVFVCPFPRP